MRGKPSLNSSKKVSIREVGPRDGLQNESTWIDTEQKIEWINHLSRTGLPYIEVSSFVHPKWIPALADAEEVLARIDRVDGVTYAALVPNEKGLERALRAGVDEVAIFMSATETHNRKNINKSIADTLPVLKNVTRIAKQEGKSVRGYLSTVFGCPYEGTTEQTKLLQTVEALMTMGIDELSLGDTIGVATPNLVEAVVSEVTKLVPTEKMALHLHDTKGMAIANIACGLRTGVRKFDSSVGGLGGCPYAPGAAGNVATEDLLYLLHGLGYETDVSLNEIMKAAAYIQEKLDKPLPSHNLQSFLAKEGSV